MRHKHQGWWGLLFVTPALLLLFVYSILPIFYSWRLSFYKVGLTGRTWVGLANYVALKDQGHLWNGLRVSLKFLCAYLLFNLVVAYLLAIALSRFSSRFCGATLSFYQIAGMIGGVSSIPVWRWLYRYPGGGFNQILERLHVPPVMFFGNPKLAVWSISFLMMGMLVTGTLITYVAVIGQINQEVIEAARLDGANELQIIWHIITPLTHPVRFYTSVGSILGAMHIWEHPFFFTGGGPMGATRTMMYEIYYIAFVKHNIGLASALTVVMTVMVVAFAILSMKKLRGYLG